MSQAIWRACVDWQPFAAAVIDGHCAIAASNAQATDLWSRRSELFRAADGRLTLTDSNAQQRLTNQLRAALGPPRLTVRIVDPASSLLHWLVVTALPALPVAAAATAPLAADRHFLISFRLSDEISALFDPERLMIDLDLTRSEAKLAAALTAGLSVNEFAKREGTTVKTARWHLENARRKLGCASQADLVRTVLMVTA